MFEHRDFAQQTFGKDDISFKVMKTQCGTLGGARRLSELKLDG